jgi:hypothetical protein
MERGEVSLDDLETDKFFLRLPQTLESGSEDPQHLERTGFGKMPDPVPDNSGLLPVEGFRNKDLHDVRTEPGAVVPSVNIDPRGSHEVHGHHILMGEAELIPGIFLSHAPNLM